MISAATLKARYEYRPDTGEFIHLVGHGRRRAGDVAGAPNSLGYITVGIGGRNYYAHRLAFIYMTGRCPQEVDHINGDPSDNRWCNLRAATHSQNLKNMKLHKTNTSGFKGVSWCSYGKSWRASIKVNGKNLRLGRFKTPEEAAQAYNLAADEYHGEFKRK